MAIITRPNKTGGGTDVVASNDVLAQEWNGDMNTIYSDYNGNITEANCSVFMRLPGTNIADAPNGIPTAKINDGAVQTAKIADSPNGVTKAKISPANVSLDKLATLVQAKADSSLITQFQEPMISVQRKTSAANYIARVIILEANGNFIARDVTPTTAIPVATKELLAVYLADTVLSGGPNSIAYNVIFVSIDRT